VIKLKHILTAAALIGLSFCGLAQSDPQPLSQKDQDKFNYYFFEAAKYRSTNRPDQALSAYMQCLNIDKNNATVLFEVGRIYVAQGNLTQGINYLKQAHAGDLENRWIAQQLAEVYKNAGMIKEATDMYAHLHKLQPENVNYLFEQAQLYFSMQNWKECLKALDAIEAIVGPSEEIIVQKKDIYLMLNDVAGAEKELTKLVKQSPNNIEYLGILAQFYIANDKGKDALAIYEKMLELSPNDPRAHLDLSKIYRDKKETDKSYYHLKTAMASPDLDIDNKIQVLYSFYQLSFGDEEMKRKSYELLHLSIEATPNDPKIYTMYADFLARDNDLPGARNAFRKATRLGANQLPIWSDILLLDAQLGWQDSLAADGQQVIDMYPNIPLGYLMAGSANLNLKQIDKSIALFEEGLDYVLDNAELEEQFYILLADAYHRKNNNKKSDDYFDKALKINPNNPLTLNNYAYYLALRSTNLDKALEMTERSNSLNPNSGTFLDTWAWVLYKKGKYEQALEKIELCAENGGAASGEVQEHWGDILFKLNRKEDALEKWRKAAELGGASEFIQQKIKEGKLYE
jgi:tetratricopeptide (TPR) repeat protein